MPTGDPICPSCKSMVPHDFTQCDKKFDPLQINEDICYPFRKKKPGVTATVVNRVFYIDVSNINPHDIPHYMDKVRETLTAGPDKTGFVEAAKSAGVWEDFFIPVKGIIPGKPSLWQRIKEFFIGRDDREISATRIELHRVEVTL